MEQLTLDPSDSSSCTIPCTLFVGVQPETDSSFTLLISQGSRGATPLLLNGVPQAGTVRAGQMAYYTATMNMTRGISVILTAFSGSPKLVYNLGQGTARPALPTLRSHTGVVYSPQEPLHLVAHAGSTTVILGVHGSGQLSADFELGSIPSMLQLATRAAPRRADAAC